MIAIKGIKMPERCAKCKFCINERTNDYGSFGECSLLKHKKVNCLVWRRDDSCPLTEIVICKDCKHCYQITDAPNVLTCERHNHVSKNFYCADAERKE